MKKDCDKHAPVIKALDVLHTPRAREANLELSSIEAIVEHLNYAERVE